MPLPSSRPLPAALLLGGAALLASCGGADADLVRQQSALRSRSEAQAAEIEELKAELKRLGERSRTLEESLAARGASPASGRAAGAAVPAGDGAPAGEAAPGSAAPLGPLGEEVASFIESEAGKEKLRAFLREEEVRKEEEERRQQRVRTENFIRERVTGYLTEQLNLTAEQQGRVIDIAMEAADRLGETWRMPRGGGMDPTAFAGMREKTEEVRKEAMDKLSQALTVDQFAKLQELGPAALMMGGPGRGGFGGGGPGAPGAAPGGPGRGR